MIDYRLQTFMSVCETKSFTETAKRLCLTQPAISQHIKHLEKVYETKLITFVGKKLLITEAGHAVLAGALKTEAVLEETKRQLHTLQTKQQTLQFGATLTIANYLLPTVLSAYMLKHPDVLIKVAVDNTAHLIESLEKGELEFALIEGYFDKTKFEHHLIKEDEFKLVGASDLEIEHITLEQLKQYPLLIREKGSGSRDIFEKRLATENYTLAEFTHVHEIGSITLLKQLVIENRGLTYIYKEAVKDELQARSLKEIKLKSLNTRRAFNFVFLKTTQQRHKYLNFLTFIHEEINKT